MNKPSGGDVIPAELFQVLKDVAVKVLHSVCQQIQETQQWPQYWKMSFFIPTPKVMPKNVQTTQQLYSSHMLSKVMLKILQARLQQYVNRELSDVQILDLKEAEEPEIKLPTSAGPHIK